MQLTNRTHPVTMTRSLRAGGIRIGTRQIGTRWYEDGGAATDGSQNGAGDGDGGKDGKDGSQQDQKPKVTFTDEQQAELNRIVAKEAKAAAAKAKADAEAARTAADEVAKTKADEDAAVARGEFDTVRTSLEQDRDDAKADATRLTGEVDQYKAAMKAGIDAGWKELPEAVRKIGEKQHPEDDVLGRWTFLHDPDTAALVKELTDKAETKRGNGADPKGSGNGTVPDADKQRAQAPLYKRF